MQPIPRKTLRTGTNRYAYLVALMAGLSAGSAALAQRVWIDENFDAVADGDLPDGWRAAEGGWQVRGTALIGGPTGPEEELTVIFGRGFWKDVRAEADVTFIEGNGWFSFIVRETAKAVGMQFILHADPSRPNGLELASAAVGQARRTFQTASGRIELAGKTHRLAVETHGHWIRAYIDGQKVLQTPRGEEVSPDGRVGFRVNGVTVNVDNVLVTKLDPPSAEELRFPSTRPMVLAHRGASGSAPENTLAALRLAVESGVEAAECDVRLSADRVPVLMHDASLERTAGVKQDVSALPLAELKKLDVGRWKGEKFAGERIPTLAEALELVRGKLALAVEIKPQGIEREVLDVMQAAGLRPGDALIFSFHRSVIEKVRGLNPLLPTVWLIDNLPYREEDRRTLLADALRAGCNGVGLPIEHADVDFIRAAHQVGLSTFVWTVNEASDARYLTRIDVDGLLTDRPELMRTWVR